MNVILTLLGMVVIVAALAYWLFTGTQSFLFVGAGMVLIAIGSNEGFRRTVPRLAPSNGEHPNT